MRIPATHLAPTIKMAALQRYTPNEQEYVNSSPPFTDIVSDRSTRPPSIIEQPTPQSKGRAKDEELPRIDQVLPGPITVILVAIGASYKNQCRLEPYIPIYLIVSGSCGIATLVLVIVVVLSIICFFKKQTAASGIMAICSLCTVCLASVLLSLFLFAWFIAGNVWVFRARPNLNTSDIYSPNYCHPTLYQFAFGIIIVSYIGCAISCCTCCCKALLSTKNTFK
ncbi:unnamed protein product [Didymodactylos carnosus]|uniref:Uncharacterized protein n=1 Tax=Didymodactylos carnosus TaxID=1234261 RepID=A0A815B441_9BILA|nr:unnamed protein product [Didymodactylos carnosus]CAF4047593.1 unnamed protein product [Didymodactylos carnosus]